MTTNSVKKTEILFFGFRHWAGREVLPGWVWLLPEIQSRFLKIDSKSEKLMDMAVLLRKRNSSSAKSLRLRMLWLFLGVSAYGLHLALGRESGLVEVLYSRGLFVGFRWLWDFSLGLSPLPLYFILFTAGLAGIIRGIIRFLARRRDGPPRPGFVHALPARLGKAGLLVLGWAGGAVFFFYLLWGFNYGRVPVENQLGLDVRPLDADKVREEASWTARMLAESRASVPGATATALEARHLPSGLEREIRKSLKDVLRELGYPAAGRVRIRMFRPGGLLMRLSSSGFYFPHTGEGHADAYLTPSEMPSVIAHEMAHGYGFCDEGAAGFIGFLASEASELSIVRYSGYLSYWSYIGGELFRASREEFKKLLEGLPIGVRADLRASAENWARYRGSLSKIGQSVYSKYLEAQGVEGGLMSYDRFIVLLAAWRASNPGLAEAAEALDGSIIHFPEAPSAPLLD